MATKNMVAVDTEELKRIVSQRNMTMTTLAEKIGITQPQMSKMISAGEFEMPVFRLTCMVLGRSEEELKAKPEPLPTTVGDTLARNEIVTILTRVETKIDTIMRDMEMMADAVSRCERACHETKAQGELNRESLEVISSKITDFNGKLNRYIGKAEATFKKLHN